MFFRCYCRNQSELNIRFNSTQCNYSSFFQALFKEIHFPCGLKFTQILQTLLTVLFDLLCLFNGISTPYVLFRVKYEFIRKCLIVIQQGTCCNGYRRLVKELLSEIIYRFNPDYR